MLESGVNSMNINQFYDALNADGFKVENTGGGCTAWAYWIDEDSFICVTQDLSHDINLDIIDDNQWNWIAVGTLYPDADVNSDTTMHNTLESALKQALKLKGSR